MQADAPCEFLPWDSDFFDRRIARVMRCRLTPQYAEEVLTWCKSHAIDCLYFLADSGHLETVRTAEDYKFRLVDIRITLRHKVGSWSLKYDHHQAEKTIVRLSSREDVPVLRLIARASYSYSRFYFDPCFPTARCDALYEAWIERSCEGYADVVLVAETRGRLVGYVTCHLQDSEPCGRIGLIGVDPDARGRGVGQMLVDYAVDWFAEHGVGSVDVVTQGRNISAQRLYQRCGFLPHSVQLWYHKWTSDCVSEAKA